MFIMVVWTQYSTLVTNSTSFSSLAPSINAVFMLALTALVINPLLKFLTPKLALRGRQVVLLYAMLMTAAPISDIGLAHFLLPTMTSFRYYASAENRWGERFVNHVPAWVGPDDHRAVWGFWESDLGGVPWHLWIGPLLIWALFACTLFGTMVCVNLIIRRQWIERERLTFPLVYLPLEMAREDEGKPAYWNAFLRNRWTWIGFTAAAIPQMIAGLHVYYPNMPNLAVKYVGLNQYLTDAPWNAVGQFQLSFYPCLIGFGYLLTTETAFSVWFFYLFTKFERIAGRAFGLTGVGKGGLAQFPFEEHQGAGAWIALIVFGLWIGRRYYREAFRAVWSRLPSGCRARAPTAPSAGAAQAGEVPSPTRALHLAEGGSVGEMGDADVRTYRFAVTGAVIGLVTMALFAAFIGMQFGVALVFFVLYFILVMALTRIRAEAGLGCISGPLTLQDLIVGTAGTAALGHPTLVGMELFHWMTVEFRGAATIMPCQLESFKMAEEAKISRGELAGGLGFAIIYGMVLGAIFVLKVAYAHGGITLNEWRFREVPVTPFKRLAVWLTTGEKPNLLGLGGVGVGFATLAFLTYMRINHLWWPFHPVGFALAMTKRSVHWIWCPTFIAWGLKCVILRYGGFKLYRALLPFFLGLVLGDFFVGGVFGVIGALVPREGYCVFP